MIREAEMSIIGGAILWEGAWPKQVVSLCPEYFEDLTCRTVWYAIHGLITERKDVDLVTICAAMHDDDVGGFLAECLDLTVTKENLAHWCSMLTEEGRIRWASREMLNASERFHDEPEALASEIRRIEKQMVGEAEAGPVAAKEGLLALTNEIENELKNPGANITAASGLADLDAVSVLGPGQLTIVAGRPGMGKSSFAVGVAAHTAKKIGKVVIFSLEMTRSTILRRLVTSQGNVQIDGTNTDWPKLTNTISRLRDLDLYIDDRPGLSVADIRHALMGMTDVKLVVVDYLQLCKMEKLERQDLRVGAVTKGLRGIAKDFNCHMLALSQLNRAVEQRSPPRPVLSDLRDSGNIEEDADNIWFLYREGYYRQDDGVQDAEVIIGKNRHGKTGSVPISWRPATQAFVNPAKYTHMGWEGP